VIPPRLRACRRRSPPSTIVQVLRSLERTGADALVAHPRALVSLRSAVSLCRQTVAQTLRRLGEVTILAEDPTAAAGYLRQSAALLRQHYGNEYAQAIAGGRRTAAGSPSHATRTVRHPTVKDAQRRVREVELGR
jgi:hypothetical protein